MARARHLTLAGLTVNLSLVRRPALVVACRYHALPVVEANGCITVAMADSDDPVAQEAMVSALNAPSHVATGNPTTIDALFTEFGPDLLHRSPRLLNCTHASPVDDEVSAFVLATGDLLDARVGHISPKTGTKDPCDALVREVER